MALLYMELLAAAPGFDMRQCRDVSLAGLRRAAIDSEPRVSLARGAPDTDRPAGTPSEPAGQPV